MSTNLMDKFVIKKIKVLQNLFRLSFHFMNFT